MKTPLTSRHVRRFLAIGLIGMSLILSAEYLGFFEGLDNQTYDLFFRVRGSRPHDKELLIAAIDERTLGQLGRWPLERKYCAQFLEAVREARVVGFDIIMAESSPDDAVLNDAMRRYGRSVLPAYVDKGMNISYPASTLSSCAVGHVHVEEGIDGVVRKVFHALYFRDVTLPSFARVLQEVMTSGRGPHEGGVGTKKPQTPPDRIFQAEPANINYYGPAGTFSPISFADIISGGYHPSYFKNKIVLVGLTAAGFEGGMLVPFMQQREKMPEVEIQAHILNNLLDRNAIRTVPESLGWPLSILLSLAWSFFFLKRGEKGATMLWGLGLFLAPTAGFLLFASANLWMSPWLFVVSLTFLYVLTYIFRLDEAARELDTKYATVNFRLGSGVNEPSSNGAELGIASFLSSGGINTKIQRLLWVEQQYENKLEDTVLQRTHELSDALKKINMMSIEMILRLTKAVESKEYGTRDHVLSVGLYARKLAKDLGMSEEFIDMITFASPMHDLGKIGIPDGILSKSGALTPEEFEIIKTHTAIGAQILAGSSHPQIQMAASIALHHHEKWDGTGYPKGLRGEEIPIEARIVLICDHYDAIRRNRSYKGPLSHREAVKIITEGDLKTKREHLDPEVLRAFIESALIFEQIYEMHESSTLIDFPLDDEKLRAYVARITGDSHLI